MHSLNRCKALLYAGLVAIGLVCAAAQAAEFKNVGQGPVILYDAPSVHGMKLYIAPRGMPVEVVMNFGAWSKVRDVMGDVCWLEARQLVDRKNIVVRALNAKIRRNADDGADVVFTADKGVLLEVVDTVVPGWVRVKHADGSIGFVKTGDVWGI